MLTRWEFVRRTYGSLFVGLGFYGAMAAMGFFTIIASGFAFDSRATRVPVRLLSGEGIRAGVPVYVKGVEAGSVHSLYYVTLDERGELRPWKARGDSHGQTVVAILTFNEPPVVYPNYTLITRYLSVLGSKVVELNPGSAAAEVGEPVHQQLDYLQISLSDTARYRASGRLPEDDRPMMVATNYDDPVYLIAQVLSENRGDLLRITRNLREVTDKLNLGQRNVALLVNQAQLAQNANGFVKDLVVLTQETRDGAEDLRESRAYIDFIDVLLTLTGAFLGG